MTVSSKDMDWQNRLKVILQNEPSGVLERLASALIGKLVEVTVAVARAGFQHGGDAGPAGRQGRRFRIESKRYADTTPLSDRELLGEINHAIRRDPAIEAWILVATREVSEQVEESLHGHAESTGVPVVVIDWKAGGISLLAALCSSSAEVVESVVSKEAGILARSLQPAASDTLEMLKRDLQSWMLGFEALRWISHGFLRRIWSTPRTAIAKLGQNAAVGSNPNRIVRRPAHDGLDAWWDRSGASLPPAAVVGFDGVGKTWAVVDWLNGRSDDLPVVIVIPASAISSIKSASLSSVKTMLAGCLHEITAVRDVKHWLNRLERLLSTPAEEGPVITVLFDGMNQQPSLPWIEILRIMQDEPLAGRVRVLVITRRHHFDDKLRQLHGLIDRPTVVEVEVYDDSPGGELEQMLAFEGLTRADLHEDLLHLARTPRLFNLVVKFRDGLVGAERVTPHRLLWEYGRHTLADQGNATFSEDDWRAWLREIARNHLAGVQGYSSKDLADLSGRRDLEEREVYARLSEIIDGRFVTSAGSGEYFLKPEIISHALGMALLSHLERSVSDGSACVSAELDSWLDPISGMDQRAEILRASVSILIEQGSENQKVICGALVTSWLQTQNLPACHREEVCRLAQELVFALLFAIEESAGHAHAAAREWGMAALCRVPRNDSKALGEIIRATSSWMLAMSRDVHTGIDENAVAEARRSIRWTSLLGEDRSGRRIILGNSVVLMDQPTGLNLEIVPVLLEGFPLSGASKVFEAAALQLAVRKTCDAWQGLKWLCLLNGVDTRESNAAIRSRALAVAEQTVESGIDDRLPKQVASLMLRLSGEDSDDDLADRLNPGIDRQLSYEKDYLSDPGKSFFALERRHADQVLRDSSLNLWGKVQRTKDFFLDSSFRPPVEFAEELREFSSSFNVSELSAHGSQSREDIDFREMEPVLARCVPDALVSLIRRKISGFDDRPPEARYWSAIHASDHSLLIDDSCRAAIQSLRERGVEERDDNELYAKSSLLMLELIGKPAIEQIPAIIERDLKYILVEWAEVLSPLAAKEGAELISRYRNGTIKQQADLLLLLSESKFPVDGEAWNWVLSLALDPGFHFRHVACELLVRANASRFGHHLENLNWSWTPGGDVHVDHYCSLAIVASSLTNPFEQVTARLVPWLVPKALSQRCGDATEAMLAAEIFGAMLTVDRMDIPDIGARAQVNRSERKNEPFTVSIEIPQPDVDETDPFSGWASAMDPEKQLETRKRVVNLAVERINQARAGGASFFLISFDPEDLKRMILHAPHQVEQWLEGMETESENHRRRVRLAEGAYVSLCEALLEVNPEKGAALWRSLRKLMFTRFIGVGKVDELIHIAFRVRTHKITDEILAELVELRNAKTDKDLMDLVIAAKCNSREDWLRGIIAADLGSEIPWRLKRAVVLRGFFIDGELPNEEAWQEGGFRTTKEVLFRRSAQYQWRDSCAKHWWRCFIEATDAESAYAAWVLFFQTADRRALNWLRLDEMRLESEVPMGREKLRHYCFNRQALKRAIEKREDKLDEQFLGRKVSGNFGPWRGSL